MWDASGPALAGPPRRSHSKPALSFAESLAHSRQASGSHFLLRNATKKPSHRMPNSDAFPREQSTPMRIVHVAPYYHPSVGGGETHLKVISEGLVQRGHQVTVLTRRHTSLSQRIDRTLRESEIINGVHVRRLPSHFLVSNLIHTIVKLPGGYRLLRALLGTSRLVNFPDSFLSGALLATVRARPDLVVVENWGLPGVVWQFALLRNV